MGQKYLLVWEKKWKERENIPREELIGLMSGFASGYLFKSKFELFWQMTENNYVLDVEIRKASRRNNIFGGIYLRV